MIKEALARTLPVVVSAVLLLLISDLRAAACFAPLQSMTSSFRDDIWALQFVEVLSKDNLPLHVPFFFLSL